MLLPLVGPLRMVLPINLCEFRLMLEWVYTSLCTVTICVHHENHSPVRALPLWQSTQKSIVYSSHMSCFHAWCISNVMTILIHHETWYKYLLLSKIAMYQTTSIFEYCSGIHLTQQKSLPLTSINFNIYTFVLAYIYVTISQCYGINA